MEERNWLHCTLCRSGREGASTLQRAHLRNVTWPEPNTSLAAPIQGPVVYTSLDDAFASMMQLMSISTRKCSRYHNSHKSEHRSQSQAVKHRLKYHSPRPVDPTLSNPLSKTPSVHVNTVPGTYAITASRWGGNSSTTHVIRVDPEQSVSLTFDVNL
ncbi:uncharacterized protein LOC135344677 [Halichondria panicea]|uniref:uncharacterized protein LOC135344677 n=1 Tax=Halichondria panicea TaxID=6063 RepID=UPI00312B7B30